MISIPRSQQAILTAGRMATTAGIAALCGLPAARLRQAAFACGSALTGRKAVLAENLYAVCNRRVLDRNPCRVVSIDLGVKNIGICRLLAPHVDDTQALPTIESWHLASLPPDIDFVYPSFSNAAINILREQLAAAPVDAVVVEKQRARTSGSPMIPNGVLRVNVMEGMVFTALHALFPGIYAESVAPRHVVDFWRAVYGGELPARTKKVTAAQSYRQSKQVRRTLLNRWIAEPAAAPLKFGPEVDIVRHGKRDDMDDALVQALAWTQWRANSGLLLANMRNGADPLQGLAGAH